MLISALIRLGGPQGNPRQPQPIPPFTGRHELVLISPFQCLREGSMNDAHIHSGQMSMRHFAF